MDKSTHLTTQVALAEGMINPKTGNMWPTPRAQEPGRTTEGYGRGLAELVEGKEQNQKWPTPTTRDFKGVPPDGYYRDGELQTDTVDRAVHAVSDGNSNGQLSPDWVEWLMGWPISWTSLEPIGYLDWRDWKTDPADADEIPRVATGIKCRADRLKAIGNGQVPQVAAMAWNILNK